MTSGQTLLRAAARAFEDDIGAVAAGHLADDRHRVAFGRVECAVGAQFSGHAARLIPHIHRDEHSGAAVSRDLQALQPHASLAENGHRIPDCNLRGLNRGYAVAQRLQTGGLAIRNVVGDLHQRDFGKHRVFREASRQLKTDDRAFSTKMIAPSQTEGTILARQLGPGRHAVADAEPRYALAGLHDSHTEFVSEQLHRGLGLQAAFDLLERQRADSECQLRLGDTGLNAQDFDGDVPRRADRFRNLVQPHIVEPVKAPGSHLAFPNCSLKVLIS